MAFGGKKGTKFGIRLGDKAYGEMKLFDTKWLAKGNGIYAEFASQGARETFAGTVGAYLTGEWQHDQKKAIKIKKHGRLSMSLFRYGLDYVQIVF